MPVNEIRLPKYTLGQELWNSISHGIGAVLALIFGPFLIVKAARSGDSWSIVSCSIFVLGLLLLYTFSCLYHALVPSNGKRVLRVMDHNMVFILIMATYAPYCLITLRSFNPWWAWGILTAVWSTGILGIVLNSVNIERFAKFSMVAYIGMGWAIVVSFIPLCQAMAGFFPGPFLLLVGGILYSVGAVLYGIGGKKNQWFHAVFHFFVLFASIFMFLSVYFFVI